MDVVSWLKTWLRQHPLKGPSEEDRARFTAEVMARVRALTPPEPAPAPVRRWAPWPGRAALAMATAAAGIAVVLAISPRTLQWAEPPADNDAWMNETLELLDQLEEDVSDNTAGETMDEDWFEELELLNTEASATAS